MDIKRIDMETMKLWEILAEQIDNRRPIPNFGFVVSSDEKLATEVVRKRARYFTLRLIEEILPTPSNMIGLLYAKYLALKDIEIVPGIKEKPTYFEGVLQYTSDM